MKLFKEEFKLIRCLEVSFEWVVFKVERAFYSQGGPDSLGKF